MHSSTIVGRMGSDPKPLGQTGCYFSVATEAYNPASKQRETTWSRIKAFGKNAEFVNQYLGKGRLVAIVAHYEVSEYDDKQTGQKRQDHSFIVDRIEPLPDGSGQQRQQEQGFGNAGPQGGDRPLW